MAKKKAAKSSGVKTHALDTPKYLDLHKKKSGMAYRYVKKTAQDIGRRKMDGWVITDGSADNAPLGPNFDGSSQIGTDDLVLMETTIENRDMLRSRPLERQRRRIEGTTANDPGMDPGMSDTKISTETLSNDGDSDKIFNS
jgi:hypothetical protein